MMRDEFSIGQDFEFITYYRENLMGHRDKIASLQMILANAAADGDLSARQAYVDAAAELASLVLAVKNRIFPDATEPVAASCTGGLMKVGELITVLLREQLNSIGARWTEPLLPPAAGAILNAYEDLGYMQADLAAALKQLQIETEMHGIGM